MTPRKDTGRRRRDRQAAQRHPADEDWRCITEMDYVFDRIAPTLQRIANETVDEDDFARVIPALEKLIADFKAAKAKGSRLTL